MARRKNTKRIDPRYFLHETVNRGEEIEEGLLDNIKSFVAKRSPGKALAHRIKSYGGGARGAEAAAADLEGLAKGEYENDKSPLLKTLQRAYSNDPELYRATIVQVALDDIGEDLTRPPSRQVGRGASDADIQARDIFNSLDKPGKQLMLRMWDDTRAARDYEDRTRDAEYAKEKAARAKQQSFARNLRRNQLNKADSERKDQERAARDRKELERRRDASGIGSGKMNYREE